MSKLGQRNRGWRGTVGIKRYLTIESIEISDR